MGSLRYQISEIGLHRIPQIRKPHLNSFVPSSSGRCSVKIRCGLRSGPRKPLWRSRVLSTEAIQAVQSLKLAKSPEKLEQVFSNRINRLLKADLLDALAELQRQNELDLAFKVFEFVRKEVWYVPDLSLFSDMILMFARNKMVEMAEELLHALKGEGLKPDSRTYTEMIGAYFRVDMQEKAIGTYELMKSSGCVPDKLTFTILIRNLEKAGKVELATSIRRDCTDYMDSPEKFLQELEKHNRTQTSVNLV